MINTQHTPGPWHCWTTTASHAPIIIYTGEIAPKLNAVGKPSTWPGTFIAQVSVNHGEHGEDNSNARLIAAAPELLESLKEIMAFHDCGKHPPLRLVEYARAAIAHAEGK